MTEYLPGGSLADLFKRAEYYFPSMRRAVAMALDCSKGMTYLHSHKCALWNRCTTPLHPPPRAAPAPYNAPHWIARVSPQATMSIHAQVAASVDHLGRSVLTRRLVNTCRRGILVGDTRESIDAEPRPATWCGVLSMRQQK